MGITSPSSKRIKTRVDDDLKAEKLMTHTEMSHPPFVVVCVYGHCRLNVEVIIFLQNKRGIIFLFHYYRLSFSSCVLCQDSQEETCLENYFPNCYQFPFIATTTKISTLI